ncbi:ribosome-binding factor A [Frigoribacterium sp. Leaf263]|uniref:30S ribosome-binding factor RbfA n=1 Tax=Frigoribacterium sp. Leaf263 TaxID=1736313 RepID=UPI0006F92830|nr:30S ribosome-binding factor RbfA [Frigoribacterium sp. Leaf263]KQO82688.1 ribosome-binding factor A [Frigoribacterium sp. Leaf263]
MVDAQRARKMADRIQEIVARRLERGIRDPRLGFVTITDVKVTGDLQHASIFYTVYGTDEERRDTGAALKSATGMLRSEVGKNITARLTPSLEFILDALPENAASIDRLLQEARQRDHESQTMASSAEFAGEADPYVKPRDLDADDLDDDDLDGDDPRDEHPAVDAASSGDDLAEPDGSTR